MKILFLSCFIFLWACEPESVSVTWPIGDEGCMEIGFREEVIIEGPLVLMTNIEGQDIEFEWNGKLGKWKVFGAEDGKRYKTFLYKFCLSEETIFKLDLLGTDENYIHGLPPT